MGTFRDHFSGHANRYGDFRPRYPDALFAWLHAHAPAGLAWDCATGNGHAATGLAAYRDVFATDASDTQVARAEAHPRVRYAVGTAYEAPADALALVTVAQALHWFDAAPFFAEVTRVLVPGGLFCAWSYGLFEVDDAVDAVVGELYREVVGPFWPPERRHVEDGYATFPWPHPLLEVPSFTMAATWSADHVLGYLRTWSASRRYVVHHGRDPVQAIEAPLRQAWGGDRAVRWPLTVRAWRRP